MIEQWIISVTLGQVLRLALRAMETAGAESGWFWFLGDLIECYQTFNHGFNNAVILKSGRLSSENVSSTAELALEGFSNKLGWLTARPLGGKQSNEEFQQAVDETEQAFLAEVIEQRRDGGLGVHHEVVISKIEKEMKVLIERVRRQGEKSQQLELDEEKEW
jgi:hypothetical protein